MHARIPRRRFLRGLIAVTTATSTGGWAVAASALVSPGGDRGAVDRLDRLPAFDLQVYRDRRGRVRPVRYRSHWQRRREEILAGFRQILGEAPPRPRRLPLDLQVESEVDAGGHVRQRISYVVDPGLRTPAYLLIPHRVRQRRVRVPAVLCLHPTEFSIGPDVVVGLGGRPNRQYAAELADRGFVTLAPAYPMMGGYRPDLAAMGYASGTLKAIEDNRRGLDVLETLPFVRRGGFGAIGHSLGGHNAVFTAALDDRIRVVVSSCGLDAFVDHSPDRIETWQVGRGWCQELYMPRLAAYAGRLDQIPFDFPGLIGALAPRQCLLSAPLGDDNFRWDSVDRIATAARAVYALHGCAGCLVVEHPDCGHDFPPDVRDRAYALLERGLGSAGPG